ncbi:MAG TPA: hypothetical protein VK471_11645 [Solirubrobacterales bacterium]|nr:hypothetical protein [Solirubrobacterales bacterium]
MTTFGPSPWQLSLYERLVGATLVLHGRVNGVVEEWPDPADERWRRLGLIEVEVTRVLRGEAPDRIHVRLAGTARGNEVEWAAPVEPGAELLFLLAVNEGGESLRYGLQHDSAFPLRDDVLELPEDLLLGEYAEEPGRLPLDAVARMLDDIDAAQAERAKHYEEVGGRDWDKGEYPPVEEMGGSGEYEQDDREPGPAGPRGSRPAGGDRRRAH